MQLTEEGHHFMSQANPSWLMTKFWIAAALGAPIYLFQELLVFYRQRIRQRQIATQRAEAD